MFPSSFLKIRHLFSLGLNLRTLHGQVIGCIIILVLIQIISSPLRREALVLALPLCLAFLFCPCDLKIVIGEHDGGYVRIESLPIALVFISSF